MFLLFALFLGLTTPVTPSTYGPRVETPATSVCEERNGMILAVVDDSNVGVLV